MSNILIVRYLLAVGLQMISQMATGCAPRSMAGCVRSSSWTEVSFECENKCLLLPFSHCKRASFKSLHCGFESARPGVCKHWDIVHLSSWRYAQSVSQLFFFLLGKDWKSLDWDLVARSWRNHLTWYSTRKGVVILECVQRYLLNNFSQLGGHFNYHNWNLMKNIMPSNVH